MNTTNSPAGQPHRVDTRAPRIPRVRRPELVADPLEPLSHIGGAPIAAEAATELGCDRWGPAAAPYRFPPLVRAIALLWAFGVGYGFGALLRWAWLSGVQ